MLILADAWNITEVVWSDTALCIYHADELPQGAWIVTKHLPEYPPNGQEASKIREEDITPYCDTCARYVFKFSWIKWELIKARMRE